MIAVSLTPQILADGVVAGLVYGLIGMGVVLVYRSTRVINFAVGAMGLPGVAVMSLLFSEYHVPYVPALALGLLAGLTFAAVAELVVVRRLFDAPRVILLVATIGLSQLALAIMAAIPRSDDFEARFPAPIGGSVEFGQITLRGGALATILVVPTIAALLGWILTRTRFGKTITASADNPDLARISGISPKRASTFVWVVAGLIATICLILIAGQTGSALAVATLGPATVTRALAVAVLARMASFPRALAAGVALGVLEGVVGFNVLESPGLIDTVLLVIVLVAVVLASRRDNAERATRFSFAPKVQPIPEAIRDRWWVKHHGRLVFVAAITVGVIAPFMATAPSRSYLYSSVLGFALVALSVSIITGWAGQLSLGQMAFAGLGALGTATLVRSVTVGLPGGLQVLVGPTPLPLAIVAMTLVCTLAAALLGAGSLRLRGLLLAVTTFVFAFAAQQHLFRVDLLTGGATPPIRLPRGTIAGVDLTVQRTYYWCVLGVLALVVTVVARLRRRAPWRRAVAVRDNEATASAYAVRPAREKLVSFALAGGIAGLGGALLGALSQNINTNQQFVVGDSLDVVAMAVIGGLGSVSGPVLGALWIKGLPAFFPDNDLVPLFSSSLGLLVLLLYFPGGLVQLAYAARDALFARVAARAPVVDRPRPRTWSRPERAAAAEVTGPAVAATDVVVAFGGVRAVDHASITVGKGEIVGLIGTNGAGKSTLLNAIGGFVPASGTIHILGHEVSGLPPHERAAFGLGRTFQAAALFPELTVRETVMVALEARHRTGLLAHALALPAAGRDERRKRVEADEILGFLGLGRYADSLISALSTGTRRIVELSALLAVDARVLCLDEPTAGVAQRETEAFGPLLLAIRAELDASVLVVEHDMPLIMSMSDRVYCLEAGTVIAEGSPDEVRNDPAVIASYLGTDDRAIARSGAVS